MDAVNSGEAALLEFLYEESGYNDGVLKLKRALSELERARLDWYYMGEEYLDGVALYEKGRKQLDDYMKTEILPGCSKAVQEASPVAAEGWRNKSQYVPCVMYGTEHFSELTHDTGYPSVLFHYFANSKVSRQESSHFYSVYIIIVVFINASVSPHTHCDYLIEAVCNMSI